MIQPILPDVRVPMTATSLPADASGNGGFAAVFGLAGPVAGDGMAAPPSSGAVPVPGLDDAIPSESPAGVAMPVPVAPSLVMLVPVAADAEGPGAPPVAQALHDPAAPRGLPLSVPEIPVATPPPSGPDLPQVDPALSVAADRPGVGAAAVRPGMGASSQGQPTWPPGQADPAVPPAPTRPVLALPRADTPAPIAAVDLGAPNTPAVPGGRDPASVGLPVATSAGAEGQPPRADLRALPVPDIAAAAPTPRGADQTVTDPLPRPVTPEDAVRIPVAAPAARPADQPGAATGTRLTPLPTPAAARLPGGSPERVVPAPAAIPQTPLPAGADASPRAAVAAGSPALLADDAPPLSSTDPPRVVTAPAAAASAPPPSTGTAPADAPPVAAAPADMSDPPGIERVAEGFDPAPVPPAPVGPANTGPGDTVPVPLRLAESVVRAVAAWAPAPAAALAPRQAPAPAAMAERDILLTLPDALAAPPTAPPATASPAPQAAAPAPAPGPTAPPAPAMPPAGADLALGTAELGGLNLRLSPEGEGLHLLFLVERPETLDLMRRHADALLADLRAAGVTGATLDFSGWEGAPGSDRGAAPAPHDAPPADAPPAPAAAPVPVVRPALPVTGTATLNLRL